MKELLKIYLDREPKARERKNKYRALGNILIEKYTLKVDKSTMEDIVFDAIQGDRYWRKILSECPELRGSDYGDKEELEQKAEIELGYTPGYFQDVRQVSLID